MADDTLKITTNPLGGSFLVLGLAGTDQINQLPEYRVDCVGKLVPLVDKALPVTISNLLGTAAEVKMTVGDDKRFFGGYITRVAKGERLGRYTRYTITLRPALWFASRARNSRVFQKKSVKDIVDDVLGPYGLTKAWRLESPSIYPKLDYCVQYNETDFDFVSRLLQRAGINYFHEYADGEHTLVFVDGNAKFKSNAIADKVEWADSNKKDGVIWDWRSGEEVRSAKVVVQDHDYLATATSIEGTKKESAFPPSLVTMPGTREVYDYPGDVVQNSQLDTAATSASTDARNRATALYESLRSMRHTATGRTNFRGLAVGATFDLTDHTDDAQNTTYIVVGATFDLRFGAPESVEDLKKAQEGAKAFYAEFVCTGKDKGNVRPDVTTPKPMMRGPQTALVVGAKGNEIETDKHGRVKIQFFWDRLGKNDQNSSCFVRVATPWASKNFGMIALPRVGDEVVVDFIDGDPDRPLIVGSVYNDVNPPIYKLPDNATMSGIKTRSSKKGDPENANELRFEDKKGSEYVWLQAEKDFYRYVKKDAYGWIGQNETLKTVKDRKDVVGENWSLDVGKDVMHNFGKDLHVTVAGDIFYKGGATWQVLLAKDLSMKVDGAVGMEFKNGWDIKSGSDLAVFTDGVMHVKASQNILMDGAQKVTIKTANVVIDASAGILLKVGGSLVNITPAGVDIVGGMVKINSGGGGGPAPAVKSAKPNTPKEAKKLEDLTSAKKTDYDKNFDDPLKKK